MNLNFLYLEHVREFVLVESVGASLPFLAPIRVSRSEDERTSEQALEPLLSFIRALLNLRAVLVPEV